MRDYNQLIRISEQKEDVLRDQLLITETANKFDLMKQIQQQEQETNNLYKERAKQSLQEKQLITA